MFKINEFSLQSLLLETAEIIPNLISLNHRDWCFDLSQKINPINRTLYFYNARISVTMCYSSTVFKLSFSQLLLSLLRWSLYFNSLVMTNRSNFLAQTVLRFSRLVLLKILGLASVHLHLINLASFPEMLDSLMGH